VSYDLNRTELSNLAGMNDMTRDASIWLICDRMVSLHAKIIEME
jgi:hypothetical protein